MAPLTVAAMFLPLLQISIGECPDEQKIAIQSNNAKFSGTCQVYKRGESPCLSDDTQLSEYVGWTVVLGFGGAFSLITVGLSYYEYNILGTEQSSEQFNTAGRNIGPGLTAAVIVSQWTWAATLQMSSNMGFMVGISGPFWYASGATVQILLFATLAIQVKRRASHMHTFMEIVKARFGRTTHCIMICFALATNIIVTSMLLLGGAGTIQDLTGMSQLTAAFLIPILSCWLYTMYGGLRATFIASYVHTTVIFVMLLVFTFSIYAGSGEEELWGTPLKVYDGLEKASMHAFFEATVSESEWKARRLSMQDGRHLACGGVNDADSVNNTTLGKTPGFFSGLEELLGNDGTCYDKTRRNTGKACRFSERGIGNPCCSEEVIASMPVGSYCRRDDADCISVSKAKHFETTDCDFEDGEVCVASFLTMGSTIGLLFGATNLVGNFGNVFVDQSYWQSAVAAKPRSAVGGFLIGGMVWFAVPFAMATSNGLAGRALTTHEDLHGMHGSYYITAEDSEAGLTPARVLQLILGTFGAFILLVQLFLAITSTGSAEMIAVSSILTYDVYYEYINPELKNRREKLRRLFYSVIPQFVGCKNEEFRDEKREAQVRLELKDKTIKLTKVQTVLDELALRGFFVQRPTEAEMSKLSAFLDVVAMDDEILVPDLYNAVNKAMSSNNIEGLVLLRVSMFFTGLFAVFMGFLAVLLLTMGMSLGQVFMSMGVFVGGAVGPSSLTILMETANGKALSAGCLGGLVCGIVAWTVRAQEEFGTVEFDTVMSAWPWVFGNLTAIVSGLVIALVGSLLFPDREFKWEMLNDRLSLVDDIEPQKDNKTETDDKLNIQVKLAFWGSVALTAILLVLWPIPMHLYAGVLTPGGFTWWVALEMLWAVVAGIVIITMPAMELFRTFMGTDKVDLSAPSKILAINVSEPDHSKEKASLIGAAYM